MKAKCSAFGLTSRWVCPVQAIFLQHLVLLPLCVAGHIAHAWRESGPWVSGKGAFGVGSICQLGASCELGLLQSSASPVR